MIKSYKENKILYLTLGLLWLVAAYYFLDFSIVLVGMLALLLIIGIAYSPKLLTNIIVKDGFYIFKIYSIVSQKEEFKISKTDLNEISYKSNFHILILKYKGTNGIVSKKLALNTEPWSEMNSEISRIKKTISNNV